MTTRPPKGNLFTLGHSREPGEHFATLLDEGTVRVERIVSHGERSPDGFWYDQKDSEWVLLLAGAARLQIEGEPAEVELGPGDFLTLPPRLRHRVSWTDPRRETIWLAVHFTPRKPVRKGRKTPARAPKPPKPRPPAGRILR